MTQATSEVASKLGLTIKEIEERVSEKVKKFEGFLTREAALNLVASEAGLDLEGPRDAVQSEARKLAELKPGENASTLAVVEHVFAPKRFEKNGRRGRVCNISIKDSTSDATLVLWGHDARLAEEVEKGDVLEIRNAAVKASRTQPTGVELHANLLTQVKVRKGGEASALKAERLLPQCLSPAVKLSSLAQGSGDVNCFARVVEVGEEKEFKREFGAGGRHTVARCLVSDGTAQVALVLWDGNSEVVRRLKAGDAIKVEDAYVRANPATGRLELNAGWKGHVVLNPGNHGLPDAEKLIELSAPKKELAQLAEGDLATIEGKISRVYGGKSYLACMDCGARNAARGEAACECGSRNVRAQEMIACEIQDATKAVRCMFWGAQALRLLGLGAAPSSAATVEAFDTAFELKRDSLAGRKVKAIVRARKSSFTNEVEGSVRSILALEEPPEPALRGEAPGPGVELEAGVEREEVGREAEDLPRELPRETSEIEGLSTQLTLEEQSESPRSTG